MARPRERRIDSEGVVWELIHELSKHYVVIRPVDSTIDRTILRGKWTTWRSWPDEPAGEGTELPPFAPRQREWS
jgi:hypothetical protein